MRGRIECCIHCLKRSIGCHATCKEYRDEKAEFAEYIAHVEQVNSDEARNMLVEGYIKRGKKAKTPRYSGNAKTRGT